MKITDLYSQVTDQIIADLEHGTPTWLKPWKGGNPGGIMPVNAVTGRSYSGINIPLLWLAADAHGYQEHRWLTYRQAQEKNANVRKGEKATTVVFAKKLTVKNEEDEERQIAMLRTYNVFNTRQVEGLPERRQRTYPKAAPAESAAQIFIEATGADIRVGGDRAFYSYERDYIGVPPPTAFKSMGSYLATVLHELCHFTGHKTRLDRQLKNRFGTREYAAEELIAEIGSAFLCASLEIPGEMRHSSYIASWIELLKDDPKAVFMASSHASKAADFLRAFSEEVVDARP